MAQEGHRFAAKRHPRLALGFDHLAPLGALGTRVRVKPHGMPAANWTVTEFESGRLFTWTSALAPGMRVWGGHELRAAGDETDAEFWLDAGGLLGSLLSPVLRRTLFARNTRSATEGLKRHTERGGSPGR